jgi:hypothetical protein
MQQKSELSLTEKILETTNLIDRKDVAVREKLIFLINELIQKDFDALVQLLYRVDVFEKKIRHHLKENSASSAAPVIADLIIERQLEKIESRKKFSKNNSKECDEEKW